jgi:hypothetical protein
MSYCVNCGVELEKSEKACPLCGVEVLNPRQTYDEKAIRPYPKLLDPVIERINRRFTGAIVSICVAFPAVLCVVINLILDGQATWSLIVAGAMAFIWLCAVPYFLIHKPNLTAIFLPIAAGLVLYLLLIGQVLQSFGWYKTVALPLILLSCCLVYLNGILIEKRILRGFFIPAAILAACGVMVVGIEIIVKLHLFHQVQVRWSLYALLPCLAVAMACLAIGRRQSIREEIKRRLHI